VPGNKAMQWKNYRNSNWIYFLLIIITGCLAYWPLTFHLYSLKNDALSYFLPFRYHISESVQNGHFPFWSPYLYTGLPLHSDIQSGVWNPVVLIISLFTTYDMNVLQAESLFYLIIGGMSFFKLCRGFNFEKNICFLLAVSYMCSGFMIDSTSFIPWITSAAWLPLMFLYFLRLTRKRSGPDCIKLALSTTLVFLSGYLSYFIYASFILFISTVAFIIQAYRNQDKKAIGPFLKYLGFSVLFVCILCSPALISYYEFLPYYKRGSGMSAEEAAINPFGIKNLVSFVFPSSSYKLFSNNDISSRNAYVGIVPLIFLVLSFRTRWTRMQIWIAVLAVFSLLFSLGNATPVRSFFYYAIPLMNTFRHPGTIRLFTEMGILLLCGFGWKSVNYINQSLFKKTILILLAIVAAVTLFTIVFTPGWNEFMLLFKSDWNRESIKNFLAASSVYPWLLLTGMVQIITLLACYLYKRKIVFAAGLTNMLIMTWLAMPFTMVSQYNPSEVNAFIHSSPKGFPWNKATLNVSDKLNDSTSLTKFGYADFYSKMISIQEHILTPTVNSSYSQMLGDTLLRRQLVLHPFIYSSDVDSFSLSIFSPNSFTISGKAGFQDTIHIIQQYNHNWKAFSGDSAIPVHRNQKAFMMIIVPEGMVNVKLEYRPQHIIIAAAISLLFLLGCIASLIYFRAIRL